MRFLLLMLFATTALAGDLPILGKINRLDSALDSLLPADAKIEVLASGFEWSEGPTWIKDGGFLVFSDVPRNTVHQWHPEKGLSVFLKPSGFTGLASYGSEPGSNGLTTDKSGALLSCEHGDRRVSRMPMDSGKMTLADRYNGKRFNSPNDLAVHSSGDIYFTDPPYGLPDGEKDKRRELDYCGVYRVNAKGEVTLLTQELANPNGIAFSPNEKTLYVAQSDPGKAIWMEFPVKADGTLGDGRVFFDSTAWVKAGKPGLPDGLKIDVQGNLWATAPGGVCIFSPEGKHLGTLDTGERTANCAWGDDGSTLYITADMHLCRVKTTTKGAGW